MSLKGKILRFLGNRSSEVEIKPDAIKRVLVVRNGRIGDVVCMFPLLREIKENFPQWEVDVYAGIHSNFLFDYCPFVERVYTKYKTRQIIRTWIDFFKMYFRSYDLIIDAMPLRFELQASLFLLNPRWMVGLEYSDRHGVYKKDLNRYMHLHQVSAGEHAVDYLTDLITFLGVRSYSKKMLFFNDKQYTDKAETFIKGFEEKRLIALNIDASSSTRSLYEVQIVEILQSLAGKETAVLVFSLPGRRDEVTSLIDSYQLAHVYPTYETKTIYDVAALLEKMEMVISPDTSIIHIASAYDIPTVGIYKNDDIHIAGWGPRSEVNRVIRSQFSEENSLEGFSTQELISAAKSFLV